MAVEAENPILPPISKGLGGLIPSPNNETENICVTVGSTVTFQEEGRDKEQVKIVSPTYKKDNPDEPVVSEGAPLADALMFEKVGREVEVKCKEPYTVTILNILAPDGFDY